METMTSTPKKKINHRVEAGAVIGAIALNLVTLVWAFHASSASSVLAGAVGITLLGLVLGGAIGWATTFHHWGSWWVEGRHSRGAIRRQGQD
jgi:uncharacterized membrane protein